MRSFTPHAANWHHPGRFAVSVDEPDRPVSHAKSFEKKPGDDCAVEDDGCRGPKIALSRLSNQLSPSPAVLEERLEEVSP